MGEKEKKSRPLGKLILIISVLAILLVALYFLFFREPTFYEAYEIELEMERADSRGVKYLSKEGRLVKYSGEGATAFDKSLEAVWGSGMEYRKPKVAIAGDFLAAADIGSNKISLMKYDPTPVTVVTEALPAPILSFALSENGLLAVLMSEKDGNLIRILDLLGGRDVLKVERKTIYEEDGYGLSLALSQNGTKLVTQFVKNEGTLIKSFLTFYDFGKAGENAELYRIVGSFPYEDSLFGSLTFHTNDSFSAIGDNRAVFFDTKYEPNIRKDKEVKGKILKLSEDETGLAMIIEESGGGGENFLEEEVAEKKGSFLLRFDEKGRLLVKRELPFEKAELCYQDGESLIHADGKLLVVSSEGMKFETELPESVLGFYPSEDKRRYFLITSNHMKIMKLNP